MLRELSVGYLELRGVWGKNVLHLDDDEVGHSSGWHPALTCGRMGAALAISSQSAMLHRARTVDIVGSEQPTPCWRATSAGGRPFAHSAGARVKLLWKGDKAHV